MALVLWETLGLLVWYLTVGAYRLIVLLLQALWLVCYWSAAIVFLPMMWLYRTTVRAF